MSTSESQNQSADQYPDHLDPEQTGQLPTDDPNLAAEPENPRPEDYAGDPVSEDPAVVAEMAALDDDTNADDGPDDNTNPGA